MTRNNCVQAKEAVLFISDKDNFNTSFKHTIYIFQDKGEENKPFKTEHVSQTDHFILNKHNHV